MGKNLLELYIDIIQKLYDRQDEFFYSKSFDRDGIFKRIKQLRRRIKQYNGQYNPNNPFNTLDDETFIRQIDKAINVIDTILGYERLYEVNIVPLTEMKEQLESLKIMVALNYKENDSI